MTAWRHLAFVDVTSTCRLRGKQQQRRRQRRALERPTSIPRMPVNVMSDYWIMTVVSMIRPILVTHRTIHHLVMELDRRFPTRFGFVRTSRPASFMLELCRFDFLWNNEFTTNPTNGVWPWSILSCLNRKTRPPIIQTNHFFRLNDAPVATFTFNKWCLFVITATFYCELCFTHVFVWSNILRWWWRWWY